MSATLASCRVPWRGFRPNGLLMSRHGAPSGSNDVTLCAVNSASLFIDHAVIWNDAWLVARGVRPMSLIDHDVDLLEGSDDEAIRRNRSIEQRAVQELKHIAESVTGPSAEIEPIPFAISAISYDPDDDGVASRLVCGFAAYS